VVEVGKVELPSTVKPDTELKARVVYALEVRLG
jgi:hypothetical protein